MKQLTLLILGLFLLSFSFQSNAQTVYATGGPAYGEVLCKNILGLKTATTSNTPILDLNIIPGKLEFFKEILIAMKTLKSPEGSTLTRSELIEAMYVLTNLFNLYSVPEQVLDLGINLLEDRKNENGGTVLTADESLTYALFKFTVHYTEFLSYKFTDKDKDKKDAAFALMKDQISFLSKVKGANSSHEIKWHLAAMKFTVGEKEKSLEILLSILRSNPNPSQTLLKAIDDVVKRTDVQLPDSILEILAKHRTREYMVHFDVNNQWGPYVIKDYEKLALEAILKKDDEEDE